MGSLFSPPFNKCYVEEFFPYSNEERTGPKLLRTEPVANDLKQRLDDCLIENNQEDAIGLAIELSASPQNGRKSLVLFRSITGNITVISFRYS